MKEQARQDGLEDDLQQDEIPEDWWPDLLRGLADEDPWRDEIVTVAEMAGHDDPTHTGGHCERPASAPIMLSWILNQEPGAQRMPPEEPEFTPIKLSELIEAVEFVSVSDLDEYQAYICKRTGGITFVSEGMDLNEEVEFPEGDDLDNYHEVPNRRDLDLGRRVALSFVAEELPGSLDKARDIFSRKGAYSRFRQLLQATGTLDKWYAFEARATEKALEQWCDAVGVKLIDNERPS